jgi:tetratricopeptide (TPR) repeat protein
VSDSFIPVRLHVKKHPEAMPRFEANWTPTVILLDSNGKERHRIEGFLPADDFLAQLHLGLGQVAFANNRFDEAEKHFREVIDKLPNTDAAPEAQYWAGVSRYKGSGDGAELKATADAFQKRYSDSVWAKKASIWQ